MFLSYALSGVSIFRVRVGKHRIQSADFYKKNVVLITDIDKRPRAY